MKLTGTGGSQLRIENERTEIATKAQGLIAQNFPREVAGNTFVLIGGSAYAMLVGLRSGDVITNGYVFCTAAGTATTLFKLGIYSADGTTQYAVTADKSSLFGAAGTIALPLTATWTVPADGGYQVVVVSTATTTLPTLARNQGSLAGWQIGSNAHAVSRAGSGLSDLPAAPLTLVDTSSVALWVGLG